MLTAYGFVTIKNFVDNTQGVTSVIGELSKIGYTYSTEVGNYNVATYPDVSLSSFSVERDGVVVPFGLTYYSSILNISQWLYTRSIQGLITNDTIALMQVLNAEFGDTATITAVGTIATKGSYKFPSSLQVTFTTAGEDNLIYLWYTDAAFTTEYPNKEFTVVMPIDNIDILVSDAASALAAIQALTITGHSKRIETAIGNLPETNIWTGDFTWVNKDNDEITAVMPISTINYGIAANNIDYIKEAIRDYILGNSAYDQDVWQKVLPTLFIPTEFYIIPVWDRISLPNQLDSTALYSPIVPYRLFLNYTDKYMADYPQAHVIANSVEAACTYQNLQFLACGHPDNYGVTTQFDLLWPFYAAIATTSPEFGKIPEATRNFIVTLISLLKVAEAASSSSILPSGFTRTERNGVFYITTTVDTVQYLVPLKTDFAVGEENGNS